MVTTFCSAVIRDFIGREARNRQRDQVTVFREAFDVVGRVAFLGAALGGLSEVEKTIETDGRPEQGSEVISAHSQILLGAKWLIAAPDTTSARLNFPDPSGAREPHCGSDLENKKTRFWFQGGARKFFNVRPTAGCGPPRRWKSCSSHRWRRATFPMRRSAGAILTGLTMPTHRKESVSAPPAATDAHYGQELPYRLRQQSLLGEFGRSAMQTRDIGQILQRATELCAQGLETRLAKVLEYVPDDKRLLVRAGVGWTPGTIGEVSLGIDMESPAGYAFQTGQMVISNHFRKKRDSERPSCCRITGSSGRSTS